MIAQELSFGIVWGQLELQKGVQLRLELPVPPFEVLTAAVLDSGFRLVMLLQLLEGQFQERRRDDEPPDDIQNLRLQFFRFQPCLLTARAPSMRAVIVDMPLLDFSRDGTAALSAFEDACEREEMPLGHASNSPFHQLAHSVEKLLGDERFVLDVFGVHLAVETNHSVVVRVRQNIVDCRLRQLVAVLGTQSERVAHFSERCEGMHARTGLLEELTHDGAIERVDLLTPERPVQVEQHLLLFLGVMLPGDGSLRIDVQVAQRRNAGELSLTELRLDVSPHELARVVRALLRHCEVNTHDEFLV